MSTVKVMEFLVDVVGTALGLLLGILIIRWLGWIRPPKDPDSK